MLKENCGGYICKLEMLNRASQEFTASLDRDRIIHSLTHMIMEIAEAEACSIWLCNDDDADILICRAVSSRVNHGELIGTSLEKGQGIAGWVLETGQSARIDDPARDPRFFAGVDEQIDYQTRNMIAIPIQYHDKRLGVLEAVNKKGGPFEEIDVKLVETLGASAAIALENARLFGTIRAQAQEVTDMNKRLREEIDERQRAEQNLAEEHNLLRTIINIIPDSIYVKDTEGRFQIANRRAVEDARLESEARIIGKTDLDIYPDSASQNWYEQEQRIMRTGEPVINEELHGIETITEGGAARDNWALVTKVPLRNQSGEIIGLVGINRDVTGIKRAEAAFEAERNLLRTVIDNLPDNIYVKDLEGRFLLNNRISIKRMGRHSQEDLLGKTDFDIYPANLAERWRDEEVEILKSGQTRVDEQVRARAPNLGGVEWVERTRVPMRDRQGRIIGLVGINRDITEQKQIEATLRENQVILNATGRMAKVGGWEFKPGASTVFWTPETYRIHEMPLDYEPTVDEAMHFFHPQDRSRLEGAFRRALEYGEPYDMELRFITATGKKLWTHTICEPQTIDGKVIKLRGTFQDITEHKKVEEELRKERDLLNRVMETSPVAISIVSREGQIVFANKQAEEVLGLTRDKITARTYDAPAWRHTYFDGRPFPDEEQPFRRVIETEKPVYYIEQAIEHPDRDRVLLSISGAPLLDESGAVERVVFIMEDVTERKHSEEALRESEARYRILTENFPNGMVALFDHDLRYTVANGTELSKIGLSSEDLVGKTLRDLFPDEIYKRDEPALKAALRGEAQTNEVTFGDQIYQVHTLPVEDGQGNIICGMIMTQNITERKRMEDALRESEERFKMFMEYLPGAVFIKDEHNRTIYCNSYYASLLDLSPQELINMKSDEYLPPDVQIAFAEENRRVLAEQRALEFQHTFPDSRGLAYWMTIKFPIQRSNDKSWLGAISLDVTERKKAEEALHKSQAILSEAEKIAQVGAWELDLATDEFNFSDEFARIHGLSGRTIIFGKLLPIAHPEDLPHIENLLRGIRDGTLDDYDIEHRIIRPNSGEVRWVHALGKMLRDDSGKPVKLYGATQDITERKEAQAREMDLIAEREKVKVLEDFIGDASHDLRTPLAAMRLSLSVLERASDHPEMQSRHLETLKRQAAHLEELLENMLNMARLDRDADLNLQRVNIVNLISSVIDAQRIFAEQRGHTILYKHDADPSFVMGDPIYLERAIGNILKNAIYYTIQPDTIDVHIYRQNEAWGIEVTDHGIGISADDLPHIFERFYRADSSRNSERGGTGLGLSITKKIIEQHGGSIEVESVLGEGSVFRIMLPSA